MFVIVVIVVTRIAIAVVAITIAVVATVAIVDAVELQCWIPFAEAEKQLRRGSFSAFQGWGFFARLSRLGLL